MSADHEEAPAAPPAPPTIPLMGLDIHAVDRDGAIAYFRERVAAGLGGWIITPNLDHLRRVVTDDELAGMYERCDLCVADGMPLIWGSKILGRPLPGRVAGSDLIWDLAAASAASGLPLILLGGAPGAGEGAAKVLREKFPGVEVAAVVCPPMGFEKDPEEMAKIREALASVPAAMVLVALGSPKQEHLADQLRGEFPAHWWAGIGISLSFINGDVVRAPEWMQKTGIEWVHRLSQEPKRLAGRYLKDGIPFAVRFLLWCARQRVVDANR